MTDLRGHISELLKHEFLPLDLETTGLLRHGNLSLANGGQILEWAIACAKDGTDGDLSITQAYTAPVKIREGIHISLMHPDVIAMHASSGLLAACDSEAAWSLEQSDDFLYTFCCELAGSNKPRGITLLGNSVHFDLQWINAQLPQFAECLSHRVFDVSTLLRMAEVWYPPFSRDRFDAQGKKLKTAHRALDDVKESLDQVRRVQAHVREWFAGRQS